MGMVACFAAIGAGIIQRLDANPELLDEFLSDQLESEHSMDVDKSWHCIHFMLTGDAEGGKAPLAWAIMGGEDCGEDAGYGPARILQPGQVKDVAAALSAIDRAEFISRYDPVAMKSADIYLSDMCVRDGDEALEYIVEHYLRLVQFYQSAAERGDGVALLLY